MILVAPGPEAPAQAKDFALRVSEALNHTDSLEKAEAIAAQAVSEREAFDDPVVQVVYRLLCDDAQPPEGEHWEGFVARRIVAALAQQPAQAAPSAGEVERGDVVAFEFYNRATGHAIVDYSVNTHVGNLSAAKGYEARPLVYADKREEVTDGSKPIPLWQAREALDELEAAARGDAPFNHQAAAVVRAALSHKEPQR